MENSPNYPEESTIDLRLYLSLIQHWAWLLILAAILAAAAAFFYTRTLTPVFSASTTMLVNEAPSTRATDYSSIITSERLAMTYAEMMQKRPVVDATLDRLGISPETFSGSISVKPVRDTQLLTVTVEDTNPTKAAQVANVLVQVFSETIQATQAQRYAASKESLQSQMTVVEGQISELKDRLVGETDPDERGRIEARIAQYEQSYNNLALSFEGVRLAEAQTISSAVIIEEAEAPLTPIRPNVMQNTMLAAVVGLMLAAGGVFLYEYLDDSIKDPEEITRRFGLPVLAIIVSHEQEKDGPITQIKPFAPVSEAFRSLRTSVHFSGGGKPVRTILVTSPTPSDGKTTVAANLAVVIAQSGRKVTIIDADLHRPHLHKLLQRSNRKGMSSLFAQPGASLEEVLQPSAVSGLEMIGSGPIPPNPSELLGSVKMTEILEQIAGDDRTVVIDSPPVLSVTDAVLLSTLADGVVLVVKPGGTNMRALQQTIDQLRRVGAAVMGIVLNGVPIKGSRYSYYIKGYASYYHYGSNGYGKFAKNGKSKKSGAHLSQEIWNAPVAPRVKDDQD